MYLGAEDKNSVSLPHGAQRKHAFLGKIMEKSKVIFNKITPYNIFSLVETLFCYGIHVEKHYSYYVGMIIRRVYLTPKFML